jgi:methyl-accepting chemotaxis protein
MKINRLQIHFHGVECKDLAIIRNQLENIMTAVTELAGRVEAQTAQVAKIGEETRSLIATIQELQNALENVELPDAANAALDAMDIQLGIVDGLVQDLPVPDPVPEPEPVVEQAPEG